MERAQLQQLHKSFEEKQKYLTKEIQLHLALNTEKFCTEQKEVYRENLRRRRSQLQETEVVLELLREVIK